jgi:predicted small lipoprotein YifL
MRRALVLSALVLVALAGLTACGSSGGTKFEQQTLKLDERDTNAFGFVDADPKTTVGPNGPEAVSNGDQFTFRSDLIDESKKDVGDLNVTCVFTDTGHGAKFENSHAVCTGVASVPGGSLDLAVGGLVFGGKQTSGSVTGGSGKYAGATGSFVSSNGDVSHDTFTIFVPTT